MAKPEERKLPCGCFAVRHLEIEGCWIVVHAVRLCGDRHEVRDTVTPEDIRRRAMVEAEFDRAERDYLEQPI